MIDRSQTRDTPRDPVAIETAFLFGPRVAETILATVICDRTKAGHMIASDPITPCTCSANSLAREGPSTYGSPSLRDARASLSRG